MPGPLLEDPRGPFGELGYRDYLGALQRYRIEHPTDIRLLGMSSFLVDYPFADRLYPGALEVLNRLRSWGQTVILSDGDVVFQPRKVERRYPAERYVMQVAPGSGNPGGCGNRGLFDSLGFVEARLVDFFRRFENH